MKNKLNKVDKMSPMMVENKYVTNLNSQLLLLIFSYTFSCSTFNKNVTFYNMLQQLIISTLVYILLSNQIRDILVRLQIEIVSVFSTHVITMVCISLKYLLRLDPLTIY